MTFNQVVRGSNPRTLIEKDILEVDSRIFFINVYIRIYIHISFHADMAELADALDLGSSVHDVQVQVLLSASDLKRRNPYLQGLRYFFFYRIKEGANFSIPTHIL